MGIDMISNVGGGGLGDHCMHVKHTKNFDPVIKNAIKMHYVRREE